MKLRPYPWLILSFFGYFCSYGVFMPFFPAWLKSQAYAAETIGFIMASAYIFRFAGSMFFTRFIKAAPQLLTALRGIAWGSCAIMVYMSFTVQNFWLLCAGLWLFSFVNSAGIPLSDTLATTWQFQVKLDYGRVRLIGSLAFMIGVTVFGAFIGYIGEQYVGWVVTALLFCYASAQMLPPSIMPKDHHDPDTAHIAPPSLVELLKNPITTRIIIAVALIQGSHAAYYVYSVIYWKHLGIPVETTSVLWGLSVLAEVIFFFFVTKLFGKWQLRNLFYISAIATGIRWALFPFAHTFAEILPLQLMHCLTFALNHYAIVRYISYQSPKTFANLQGLYNAIAGCGSLAILSILAGWLYGVSPTDTFLVMAAFAFLAIPFIPRKMKTIAVTSVDTVITEE
ncbi:MFS transporter [Actinobacillus delphinicola]|uniref:3-phenylpropionate MFS transporter n=1 Tax=Actinobacillus delphinicola TaxID=51161 RepID=UPI0024414DFC|nr:3-phenylpropionate MFS transporter [Actinobacillus delphinicola]MDG6896625.1 MFS transporter [Actinobacillus delphinicola]